MTRCFCFLHLLGPPRVPMCRFCCPLGISLPTQPTAFWQPRTMSSLRRGGADGFATTLPQMPTCLGPLCRTTAKQPLDGHLQAVVNTTALVPESASLAFVRILGSEMTSLARER